jgi:ferritin-like metal-binding protein YciE
MATVSKKKSAPAAKKRSAKTSTRQHRTKPVSSGRKIDHRLKEDAELMELFEHGLKDILWAENALVKAIPKMIRKAKDGNLKTALEGHLSVTMHQAEKVKAVFESLGKPARGKKCTGIEGIIREGEELMEEFNNNLIDAAIIAAASKVEHYEMSSYMTLITLAEELKLDKAIRILRGILDEEKEADTVLQNLAANLAGLTTERMP